jgi:hypothetical protein
VTVSVLSANGIRKAFRRHQVLTGVDLDISAGQLARYIGMSVRGAALLVLRLCGGGPALGDDAAAPDQACVEGRIMSSTWPSRRRPFGTIPRLEGAVAVAGHADAHRPGGRGHRLAVAAVAGITRPVPGRVSFHVAQVIIELGSPSWP